MSNRSFINDRWFRALSLTTASVYIYMLMEWIFFATKTSFMSYMNVGQKLMVLLVSSFTLAVPLLVLTGMVLLISRSIRTFDRAITVIPTLIFVCLAFILFDNFTYTVFRIGVVTSQGIMRGVYAMGLLVFFFMLLKNTSRELERPSRPSFHYLILIVFFLSGIAFLFTIREIQFKSSPAVLSTTQPATRPNIILLGWDGISATRMSAYGYERDTTPNLAKYMSSALVAENAFPNTGQTGGSLTSLLTGKPPTETRVIFPPDTLLGANAYEHLPGILKQLGYDTIQVTVPYYADAYDVNILGGFDIVNFRSEDTNPLLTQLARMGGGGAFYFTGQVIFRISERIEHVFFIKDMENPYLAVTKNMFVAHDEQRLDAIIKYLKEAKAPLFIHAHLVDTHGPIFHISSQFFSAGQTQDQDWMNDFYDDALRGSDNYLNELFNYLSESGKLDDTIIILYSDHGMNWDTLDRVPLMFWFPNNQYAGKLNENAQLLDVAPTLLDYLSVPTPTWMKGRSLLNDDLPPDRPIFSATVKADVKLTEGGGLAIDESKLSPPFYQIEKVNLIVCNSWFSLNLQMPELLYGKTEDSTTSCDPKIIPSPEQAKELLLRNLSDDHYDVSKFPHSVPVLPGQH